MPKKVSKKSKTTTPVVAAKAAAVPAEKVVEEVAPPTMQDQFQVLLAQLSSLRSQLTSVTSQVRALSKRADRELKQALKTSRKKRKSGNRAPSGFVKPTKISLELSTFLGKPTGSEMARTEVTREINAYIRKHDLQDPKNGRRILADGPLRKLLKLKKSDELTYFNLQRYMSPHFAKATSKTATAPVTASA
jgi:chromatin remodeling complex protein RSC6